jgi:hypothetical protein
MRAKLPFFAALTLALPAALLPQTASAQEEPVEPEPMQCTAEADVSSIAVGETAVQVTYRLSEDIGPVVGIESPTSGLVVAAPEDLPRVDMANPEATPEPIQLSNEAENTFILWLNSANAQAGDHELFLISEQGTCATQVTIEGGV